jgi:Xaa-Pro aminopeptidase
VFELTLKERDRRWKKVREAMDKRELGALVVWDSFGGHGRYNANLRYLSNANTEGYLVFPLVGEPALVIFLKKVRSTWVTNRETGHPMYSRTIADLLKEMHLENAAIGIVALSGYYGEMGSFPYSTYVSLTRSLPGARFEDATDILETARRVKSEEEIRCFEQGCEVANRVIQAVADTAKPGVKDFEVRAVIMDTLFRNGCEPGSMILYNSGKEVITSGGGGLSDPAGAKTLDKGDIILTEFDAQYLGYMAQHNQPFSLGEPDKEWRDIFRVALEAFKSALKALKPGITAAELDEAFLSSVRGSGYTPGSPQFHGIGLSLEEPFGAFPRQPGYKMKSALIMEPGMVVEFEAKAQQLERKKGINVGCPVMVTETGCRALNKNWKPEIRVIG